MLVVIGSKVKEAVENILCDCAPELRELYEKQDGEMDKNGL